MVNYHKLCLELKLFQNTDCVNKNLRLFHQHPFNMMCALYSIGIHSASICVQVCQYKIDEVVQVSLVPGLPASLLINLYFI